MFLSVGASTEAKALHVCSVGSVSTRHAVVCVFLAFLKITISPLSDEISDPLRRHLPTCPSLEAVLAAVADSGKIRALKRPTLYPTLVLTETCV